MKPRHYVRRVTAFFTAVIFVWTNHFGFSTAHAESALSEIAFIQPIDVAQLKLPTKFGEVVDFFPGADSGQKVIVIQDAHAIPDAQKNIANVIQFMQKEYGVDTVALEGASGDLDPQIFKSFPDQKLLREVIRGYLDAGEIAGGTAAAIFDKQPSDYKGVEDWGLYEDALGFYLKASEVSPPLLEKLNAEHLKLNAAKEKIYPKDLLAVDQAVEKFYENTADLPELLKTLVTSATASVHKGSEPTRLTMGSQLEVVWKEIQKTNDQRLTTNDKDIEVREISEKIERFLKAETPRGLSATSPEVAQPVKRNALKQFNAKKQAWLTGEITAEAYALFLKETAQKFQLNIEMSTDLLGMVREQHRLKEIEGTKLFKELEVYIEAVKQKLIQDVTNDQRPTTNAATGDSSGVAGASPEVSQVRELDQRTSELRILKKLVNLELSREEWNQFKNKEQRTKNKVGISAGIQPQDLAYHLSFYASAEERDEIFFKNLISTNDQRLTTNETTIMVAGGFHAEGLTAQLKAAGIGYALVMPKIGHIPENNSYRGQMRGEVSWKDYFEVEDGRINLYRAFVRAVRDRLVQTNDQRLTTNDPHKSLSKDSLNLLKSWRDQIIRDLSDAGQIERAGWYTRFIDEALDPTNDRRLTTDDKLLSKVDNFIRGLRGLEKNKQLDQANIAKLLKANLVSPATATASLSPTAMIIDYKDMSKAVSPRTTFSENEPEPGSEKAARQEMREELVLGVVSDLDAGVFPLNWEKGQALIAKDGEFFGIHLINRLAKNLIAWLQTKDPASIKDSFRLNAPAELSPQKIRVQMIFGQLSDTAKKLVKDQTITFQLEIPLTFDVAETEDAIVAAMNDWKTKLQPVDGVVYPTTLEQLAKEIRFSVEISRGEMRALPVALAAAAAALLTAQPAPAQAGVAPQEIGQRVVVEQSLGEPFLVPSIVSGTTLPAVNESAARPTQINVSVSDNLEPPSGRVEVQSRGLPYVPEVKTVPAAKNQPQQPLIASPQIKLNPWLVALGALLTGQTTMALVNNEKRTGLKWIAGLILIGAGAWILGYQLAPLSKTFFQPSWLFWVASISSFFTVMSVIFMARTGDWRQKISGIFLSAGIAGLIFSFTFQENPSQPPLVDLPKSPRPAAPLVQPVSSVSENVIDSQEFKDINTIEAFYQYFVDHKLAASTKDIDVSVNEDMLARNEITVLIYDPASQKRTSYLVTHLPRALLQAWLDYIKQRPTINIPKKLLLEALPGSGEKEAAPAGSRQEARAGRTEMRKLEDSLVVLTLFTAMNAITKMPVRQKSLFLQDDFDWAEAIRINIQMVIGQEASLASAAKHTPALVPFIGKVADLKSAQIEIAEAVLARLKAQSDPESFSQGVLWIRAILPTDSQQAQMEIQIPPAVMNEITRAEPLQESWLRFDDIEVKNHFWLSDLAKKLSGESMASPDFSERMSQLIADLFEQEKVKSNGRVQHNYQSGGFALGSFSGSVARFLSNLELRIKGKSLAFIDNEIRASWGAYDGKMESELAPKLFSLGEPFSPGGLDGYTFNSIVAVHVAALSTAISEVISSANSKSNPQIIVPLNTRQEMRGLWETLSRRWKIIVVIACTGLVANTAILIDREFFAPRVAASQSGKTMDPRGILSEESFFAEADALQMIKNFDAKASAQLTVEQKNQILTLTKKIRESLNEIRDMSLNINRFEKIDSPKLAETIADFHNVVREFNSHGFAADSAMSPQRAIDKLTDIDRAAIQIFDQMRQEARAGRTEMRQRAIEKQIRTLRERILRQQRELALVAEQDEEGQAEEDSFLKKWGVSLFGEQRRLSSREGRELNRLKKRLVELERQLKSLEEASTISEGEINFDIVANVATDALSFTLGSAALVEASANLVFYFTADRFALTVPKVANENSLLGPNYAAAPVLPDTPQVLEGSAPFAPLNSRVVSPPKEGDGVDVFGRSDVPAKDASRFTPFQTVQLQRGVVSNPALRQIQTAAKWVLGVAAVGVVFTFFISPQIAILIFGIAVAFGLQTLAIYWLLGKGRLTRMSGVLILLVPAALTVVFLVESLTRLGKEGSRDRAGNEVQMQQANQDQKLNELEKRLADLRAEKEGNGFDLAMRIQWDPTYVDLKHQFDVLFGWQSGAKDEGWLQWTQFWNNVSRGRFPNIWAVAESYEAARKRINESGLDPSANFEQLRDQVHTAILQASRRNQEEGGPEDWNFTEGEKEVLRMMKAAAEAAKTAAVFPTPENQTTPGVTPGEAQPSSAKNISEKIKAREASPAIQQLKRALEQGINEKNILDQSLDKIREIAKLGAEAKDELLLPKERALVEEAKKIVAANTPAGQPADLVKPAAQQPNSAPTPGVPTAQAEPTPLTTSKLFQTVAGNLGQIFNPNNSVVGPLAPSTLSENQILVNAATGNMTVTAGQDQYVLRLKGDLEKDDFFVLATYNSVDEGKFVQNGKVQIKPTGKLKGQISLTVQLNNAQVGSRILLPVLLVGKVIPSETEQFTIDERGVLTVKQTVSSVTEFTYTIQRYSGFTVESSPDSKKYVTTQEAPYVPNAVASKFAGFAGKSASEKKAITFDAVETFLAYAVDSGVKLGSGDSWMKKLGWSLANKGEFAIDCDVAAMIVAIWLNIYDPAAEVIPIAGYANGDDLTRVTQAEAHVMLLVRFPGADSEIIDATKVMHLAKTILEVSVGSGTPEHIQKELLDRLLEKKGEPQASAELAGRYQDLMEQLSKEKPKSQTPDLDLGGESELNLGDLLAMMGQMRDLTDEDYKNLIKEVEEKLRLGRTARAADLAREVFGPEAAENSSAYRALPANEKERLETKIKLKTEFASKNLVEVLNALRKPVEGDWNYKYLFQEAGLDRLFELYQQNPEALKTDEIRDYLEKEIVDRSTGGRNANEQIMALYQGLFGISSPNILKDPKLLFGLRGFFKFKMTEKSLTPELEEQFFFLVQELEAMIPLAGDPMVKYLTNPYQFYDEKAAGEWLLKYFSKDDRTALYWLSQEHISLSQTLALDPAQYSPPVAALVSLAQAMARAVEAMQAGADAAVLIDLWNKNAQDFFNDKQIAASPDERAALARYFVKCLLAVNIPLDGLTLPSRDEGYARYYLDILSSYRNQVKLDPSSSGDNERDYLLRLYSVGVVRPDLLDSFWSHSRTTMIGHIDAARWLLRRELNELRAGDFLTLDQGLRDLDEVLRQNKNGEEKITAEEGGRLLNSNDKLKDEKKMITDLTSLRDSLQKMRDAVYVGRTMSRRAQLANAEFSDIIRFHLSARPAAFVAWMAGEQIKTMRPDALKRFYNDAVKTLNEGNFSTATVAQAQAQLPADMQSQVQPKKSKSLPAVVSTFDNTFYFHDPVYAGQIAAAIKKAVEDEARGRGVTDDAYSTSVRVSQETLWEIAQAAEPYQRQSGINTVIYANQNEQWQLGPENLQAKNIKAAKKTALVARVQAKLPRSIAKGWQGHVLFYNAAKSKAPFQGRAIYLPVTGTIAIPDHWDSATQERALFELALRFEAKGFPSEVLNQAMAHQLAMRQFRGAKGSDPEIERNTGLLDILVGRWLAANPALADAYVKGDAAYFVKFFGNPSFDRGYSNSPSDVLNLLETLSRIPASAVKADPRVAKMLDAMAKALGAAANKPATPPKKSKPRRAEMRSEKKGWPALLVAGILMLTGFSSKASKVDIKLIGNQAAVLWSTGGGPAGTVYWLESSQTMTAGSWETILGNRPPQTAGVRFIPPTEHQKFYRVNATGPGGAQVRNLPQPVQAPAAAEIALNLAGTPEGPTTFSVSFQPSQPGIYVISQEKEDGPERKEIATISVGQPQIVPDGKGGALPIDAKAKVNLENGGSVTVTWKPFPPAVRAESRTETIQQNLRVLFGRMMPDVDHAKLPLTDTERAFFYNPTTGALTMIKAMDDSDVLNPETDKPFLKVQFERIPFSAGRTWKIRILKIVESTSPPTEAVKAILDQTIQEANAMITKNIYPVQNTELDEDYPRALKVGDVVYFHTFGYKIHKEGDLWFLTNEHNADDTKAINADFTKENPFTVGRSAISNLSITDPARNISRDSHAQLFVKNGQLFILDGTKLQPSHNGTFVKAQAVQEVSYVSASAAFKEKDVKSESIATYFSTAYRARQRVFLSVRNHRGPDGSEHLTLTAFDITLGEGRIMEYSHGSPAELENPDKLAARALIHFQSSIQEQGLETWASDEELIARDSGLDSEWKVRRIDYDAPAYLTKLVSLLDDFSNGFVKKVLVNPSDPFNPVVTEIVIVLNSEDARPTVEVYLKVLRAETDNSIVSMKIVSIEKETPDKKVKEAPDKTVTRDVYTSENMSAKQLANELGLIFKAQPTMKGIDPEKLEKMLDAKEAIVTATWNPDVTLSASDQYRAALAAAAAAAAQPVRQEMRGIFTAAIAAFGFGAVRADADQPTSIDARGLPNGSVAITFSANQTVDGQPASARLQVSPNPDVSFAEIEAEKVVEQVVKLMVGDKEISFDVTVRKIGRTLKAGISMADFTRLLVAAAEKEMQTMQGSGVQVTHKMALNAIRFIAANVAKGASSGNLVNLGVAFDLSEADTGQSLQDAMKQIKHFLNVVFINKNMAQVAAEMKKIGVYPQIVNYDLFKTPPTIGNKVVGLVRKDAGGKLRSKDLFKVGVMNNNGPQTETYLATVENVVQILTGLLVSANIESQDDLTNPVKVAEVKRALFALLFGEGVMEQYPDVIQILPNGDILIDHARLFDFVVQYLAKQQIEQAA